MTRSQKKTTGSETVRHVQDREKEKKHGSGVRQPPLTPMIDVVFLLLLFFLLACQFRVAEGQIPSNLPRFNGDDPIPDPIRIVLRPAGRDNMGVLIEVERTDAPMTSAAELYGCLMKLREIHGEDSEKVPVFVKPLGNVRWDHVVNAFNQAVRAGYKKVGFDRDGS